MPAITTSDKQKRYPKNLPNIALLLPFWFSCMFGSLVFWSRVPSVISWSTRRYHPGSHSCHSSLKLHVFVSQSPRSTSRRSMSNQGDDDSAATSNDNSVAPAIANNNHKKMVVILAGPTGVGKSDVAARLCASQTGMIVSADSVQAYRGVMIGANKPTAEERLETPHMLVDVVDHRTANYNAADWQRDALHVISTLLQDGETTTASLEAIDGTDDEAAVEQARERRQEIDKSIANARILKGYPEKEPLLPVVVGGTMMYLQWLVHGRPDASKPSPAAVAQAQEEMAVFQTNDDWEGAVNHVAGYGPIFAQRITKLCGRDWYRLRRTLEIALSVQEQQLQGQEGSSDKRQSEVLIEKLFTGEREGGLESYGYDVRCFFLCPDDRMKHTELVDERCEVMLTRGLLNETTSLRLAGQLPEMAARAIGYRQTLDYLEREGAKDGDDDALNEYLNQFTTATRRYSKKQMQWFRKDDTFVFVPVSISEEKDKRVDDAAKVIGDLIKLPREEYDRQCFADDSVSSKTMKENEAQGKGMKFYQFKRFLLKPGTPELEKTLAEADRCTNQLQAKKHCVAVEESGTQNFKNKELN